PILTVPDGRTCQQRNIPLSLGALNPYVSAVTRGGAAAPPTKSGRTLISEPMNIQPKHSQPLILSGRDVTAVLGPTNTGKTHLAIERMVAHETGVIGLPLR